MNLEVIDDKYVVYLKKKDIENTNFSMKSEVEELFKELFLKIKKKINIELSGFFFIKVYLNDSFGAVIEFYGDKEYYDYLTNKIDMQVEIINDAIILKEYDDINYIKDSTFYVYNNLFYTKYNNDKDSEFYKIIYGDKASNILDTSFVCHLKKAVL